MSIAKNKKNCCNISVKDEINIKLNKDEELARMAKALGHPVRVQILRTLSEKESCVCGEIVDIIKNLAQSTVSQHLKILKAANLITGDIEGTAVCYCINNNGLKRFKLLMAEI